MEESFLTQVMLPAVLAFIMFGMGLSLTKEDFLRLWKMPKPVLVGLFGQLLLLPVIAYFVAILFGLSEDLAIGLMILSACPGGITSNIVSQIARANLALSVTLTAISTLICVFTTPLVIQYAISQFATGEPVSFSLFGTTIGLVVITLLPVILGVWLRQKYVNAAMRWEHFFRSFSGWFMVAMIAAILYDEWDTVVSSFDQMFAATLFLNTLAIAAGMLLGRVFFLSARDGVTLGIEVGMQNASMAMLIAVTFLNMPAYATSAGVYGITMYVGAALLIMVAKKSRPGKTKKRSVIRALLI